MSDLNLHMNIVWDNKTDLGPTILNCWGHVTRERAVCLSQQNMGAVCLTQQNTPDQCVRIGTITLPSGFVAQTYPWAKALGLCLRQQNPRGRWWFLNQCPEMQNLRYSLLHFYLCVFFSFSVCTSEEFYFLEHKSSFEEQWLIVWTLEFFLN